MKKEIENLTLEERQIIYKMRGRGLSMQKVGEIVGRHKSTISRELRRNQRRGVAGYLLSSYEEAKAAHDKALRRRSESKKVRRGPLKLAAVREFIEESLKVRKYSPENIALELEQSDLSVKVCARTIRRWMLKDAPELRVHLARKGKKPRNRLTIKKALFKDGTPKRSIHKRSKEINDRLRAGDYEGDLVVCKQSTVAILSVRERKTRKAWLRLLPNAQAETTRKALVGIFANIPPQLRLTCTFDNGSEFAKVHELERLLNVEAYFCDAYCSWQKGSVEQQNKEIRHYVPKGTDLSTLTPERLKEIESFLNHKPRPLLGKSSAEQTWVLALENVKHLLH